MKRFVALLLVCAMVLCLLSFTVLAKDPVVSPEPVPETPEESPQTGVNGNLLIVFFVMVAAMCAGAVAIKKAR